MTGLAARGVPIALARAGLEITVLAVGWFLGGTVGVATVAFAVTIGPLVKIALHRLAVSPAAGRRRGTVVERDDAVEDRDGVGLERPRR